MQKTSKLIFAALLVLATIGAYASSKLVRQQVYFINQAGLCEQAFAETLCDLGVTPDCNEDIYDAATGGSFIVNAPIYLNPDTDPTKCKDPFDRP